MILLNIQFYLIYDFIKLSILFTVRFLFNILFYLIYFFIKISILFNLRFYLAFNFI